MDAGTCARYQTQAPELMDSLTQEAGITVMKRDAQTDVCLHFKEGLCGIHASQGTDLLGDACHFFPRITRKLGERTLMTAAPSCPEITRLAIVQPHDFTTTPLSLERLPHHLRDYLPEGLSAEDALSIHHHFIQDILHHPNADANMGAISSVARSLHMLSLSSWPQAVPFYLKHARDRLPASEPHAEDQFHLLHALVGLVDAAPPSSRPRLEQTITQCETALGITLHRGHIAITITETSLFSLQSLLLRWHDAWAAHFQPLLNRWLALQLSESLFPFSGFGATLPERVTLLGMRYALVKLGLMAACHHHDGIPDEATIVRVIQSLARFMDHLSDPELSLRICQETGWIREPRLLALITPTSPVL